MCFRKTSWISVICHLLTLGLACFLFLLHKFLPSLFALVLNCVPVIVCTILLLGILLTYSELNIPGHDRDGAAAETSVKLSLVANGLGGKSERKFKGKAHAGSRKETRRAGVRTIVLGNADGKEVEQSKVDRIDATSVSSSCGEEDVSKRNSVKGDEDSAEKQEAEDFGVGVGVGGDEAKADSGCYNSCVGSPSCRVDGKGVSSECESDEAVSSDHSAATGIPLLDELDPLVSGKNSDGRSTVSSGDHESEDGSVEEEAENQDDEDDDEAQEEKGGNPVAVTWTADDQRSLVELGNSELERNRRLENLLEKRKARKILEKNLIDLDDDAEEKLQAHGRLLPINAPRRNPFDIPELDEAPGSAPSMLLPRRNPFDIPFEAAVGEGFVAVPPRDSFFRRHESFSVGSIFEFRQTMAFKPYFGAEKIGSEKKAPSKDLTGISDSVSSVKHDEETNEKDTNKDHAIPSNSGIVTEQITDRDSETEGNTSEASVLNSPTSYAERDGMVNQDYESSSSNTSDAEKKKETTETDPMDAAASGSNFAGVESDRIHDNHVEPVYDSSPTATERSHSNNLALDEAFHISSGDFSLLNDLIPLQHTSTITSIVFCR